MCDSPWDPFYITLDLIGCRHTFVFARMVHVEKSDKKRRKAHVRGFMKVGSL